MSLMGVLGVLGVVFIVLKLTGVVAWSWWLVLLPLYGGFVLCLYLSLILSGVCVLGARRVRRTRW